MKKQHVVLTLLSIPFLMANSPMPYPHPEYYSDFDFEMSVINENNTPYRYSVSVKNKGQYHLYNYGQINSDNNSDGLSLYSADDIKLGTCTNVEGALFSTQTLGPGQSANYVCSSNTIIDINSVAHVQSECFNLIDSNVTYSEPTVKELQGGSHYHYKIETKVKNLNDYYYAVAVDVKYNDKDYSFITRKGDYEFVAYEKLDLSKFSVTKMTFYRSSYNTYKYTYDVLDIKNPTSRPYIFVILAVALVFVIPIVILSVAYIRKLIKRHKNKGN